MNEDKLKAVVEAELEDISSNTVFRRLGCNLGKVKKIGKMDSARLTVD